MPLVMTADDLIDYVLLATSAAPHLERTPNEEWMRRLDVKSDGLLHTARFLSGLEAAEYATALWPWCFERGHYDAGITMLMQSCATFGEDLPFSLKMNACIGLGVLWQREQNYREAEEYLNLAWDMTQIISDPYSKGCICHYQGLLCRRTAQYQQAEVYHKQSLQHWSEINDTWGIATANDALGVIAYNQDNLAVAYTRFSQANQLYLQINDTKQRARVLNNIGMVLGQRKQYDLALKAYRQCSGLFHNLGDMDGFGKSLYNQGDLYFEMGCHAKARKLLREALEVACRLVYTAYTAFAVYDLAFMAQREERYEQSAVLLGAVETLCQSRLTVLSTDMQRDRDDCELKIKGRLHPNARLAHTKRGRKMSLPDVLAYISDL